MDLLSFVFPRRCLGCGKLGKYFCEKCRKTVKLVNPNEAICPVCEKLAIDGATHPHCQNRYALDGLTSFFRYEGIIRKATKSIKYRLVSDLAEEFISLIPSSSCNNLTIQQYNNFVLVPIPLHPARYRFRGFNQAEVLGKLLARRLNIPIKTNIFKRVKKTIPQVDMKDRDERLKNMQNVFALNNLTMKPALPAGRQFNNSFVILFDDVFTTGATLRSAANVLKRAGFKNIWGMTMAR